jgi:serine protease AprX
MPRAFVKMPSGADAHTFVITQVTAGIGGPLPYQSKSLPEVLTVNLPDQDLAALRASGAKVFADVEFEPLGPFRPAFVPPGATVGPMLGVAPAAPVVGLNEVLEQIRAPQAWQTSRGAGVIVVIVDTGICGSLLEFPAAKRSPIDLPTAYSGQHWNDTKGHGSMCGAIAAGTRAAGGKFDGVAPDATVLSARTTLMSTDIFRIYDELVDRKQKGQLPGPVVISNSYGMYTCAPPQELAEDHPYLEAVRKAVQLNMPVIFAAGNNHWTVKCNHDPASCSPNTIWAVNSHDDVLSVGTVDRNESNRDTATTHPNSSRGPGQWAMNTRKPDCVAPTYGEVVWGCGYTTMDWWGTSGACPQVAGLAALMLSKNTSLTSQQVYDIIRSTCRPIAGAATCVGNGIIDCAAAVQATP